jgi:hypothetical protein
MMVSSELEQAFPHHYLLLELTAHCCYFCVFLRSKWIERQDYGQCTVLLNIHTYSAIFQHLFV